MALIISILLKIVIIAVMILIILLFGLFVFLFHYYDILRFIRTRLSRKENFFYTFLEEDNYSDTAVNSAKILTDIMIKKYKKGKSVSFKRVLRTVNSSKVKKLWETRGNTRDGLLDDLINLCAWRPYNEFNLHSLKRVYECAAKDF